MNLRTERKWCLTGTPVQNSLDDLFSLTEFLGFYPVENRLNARRWILDPLGARDENAIENFRLLLKSITLRRSRESERNGRRQEHEVKIILSLAERELYKSIRSKAQTCVSPHDRFSYILKMRQLCSHGLREQDQRSANAAAVRQVNSGVTICQRCGEDLVTALPRVETLKPNKTRRFCSECTDERGEIADSITESLSWHASACEEPDSDMDIDMLDENSENDVDMDQDQYSAARSESSSKIRTVFVNLLELQQECHQDGTPIKR